MSAYVYDSLCYFLCLGLLLPFVLGFCLFFFFVCLFSSFFISVCVWVCVCMFLCVILVFSFAFTIWFGVLSVFCFFLPSHVPGRVLVLQWGIGPEPPRWESESRTLDYQRLPGPMKYQLARAHPEISISTLRPSSTQQPASSSAGHPMPNN